MATAQEQLMGMLNPQTARLLDNQMRQKQVAQRSQGAGMLSGLTQAYTGMADAVTGAAGLTPMGANEQKAIQANKSKNNVSELIRNAEGQTQSEKYFNASKQLAKSTSPYAQAKAEELYQKGVEAAQLEQTNKLQGDRIKASSRNVKLIVDSKGRQFQMITDELTEEVSYTAVDGKEGSPEGAIKTQADVSSDNIAKRQQNLAYQKQFLEDNVKSTSAYKDASVGYRVANEVLDLLDGLSGKGVGGVGSVIKNDAMRFLGIESKESLSTDELHKKLSEHMLKSLKATFGGSQITDSERIFLQSTMPSLMDSPTNIKRKMEANKKLMRHIMERENALSQTSNFSEYQEVRKKYQTEEYKELLSSGGEITRDATADADNMTEDQILANEYLEKIAAKNSTDRHTGRMGG